MLPTWTGVEPGLQLDRHPTEPPRPAFLLGDLKLRWVHMSKGMFTDVTAQMIQHTVKHSS